MNVPEQAANNTRYDRYPEIFRLAQLAAGPEPARILSFGCSTGEEPKTLAEKYFAGSQIVGVDVSWEVLEKARALTAHLANVTIAQSELDAIAGFGPYDAIFAMSVLCRNPAPKDHDWTDFPFARFESRVAELTGQLKSDGIFVLVNSNYNLTQSRLIRFYDLVVSPKVDAPQQVWKLAPDGSRLEKPGGGMLDRKTATDCVFRKRRDPWPDGPNIPLRIVGPDGAELVTIWLSCVN
jgi:SAM-dependent methyltransferase